MPIGFPFKNACLVYLSLVIGTNIWTKGPYRVQNLIWEYENLRFEYADDYWHSLNPNSVIDLLEISRVYNFNDFLLLVGLENRPNFNAIGLLALVIKGAEDIKGPEQIYVSAAQNEPINLNLLEAFHAIRDAATSVLVASDIIKMSENESTIVSAIGLLHSTKSAQANIFVTALIMFLAIALVVCQFLNHKKKLLINNLSLNPKTKSKNINTEELENYLGSILTIDIFEVELASTSNLNSRKELFFELFEIIVKEHLYASPGFGLNQLAQKVKSNSAYVSEAINSNSGMSFNGFINRIRITKAQYLFLKTDISIEAVMEYCGYRNRSTFYRVFKKEAGLTPGEFIEKKRTKT